MTTWTGLFPHEVALARTMRSDSPGFRCARGLPETHPADFNSATSRRSRTECPVCTSGPTPGETMPRTKVDLNTSRIARLQDAADLAELLFPGNRNQQHCFLVIWFSLKWAGSSLVPNLAPAAEQHTISRRTLERVRAKLRRLGLIDHVSRFSARHGGREGWVLSTRFERSLRQLAEKLAVFREGRDVSRDKEQLLIELADARRAAASQGGDARTVSNKSNRGATQ